MDRCLFTAIRAGAAVLLAGVLTGCTSGGPGPPTPSTSASTPSTEPTFPSATAENLAPTTEATTSGDTTPMVSLPGLPVGGASAPEASDNSRQCITFAWSGTPEIPKGYAVEVVGAVFSAPGYEAIRASCEADGPHCIGYVMRAGSTNCNLVVRTLPTANPDVQARVGLKGILYCPKSIGATRCNGLAAAMAKAPGGAQLIGPQPVASRSATGTTQPALGGG